MSSKSASTSESLLDELQTTLAHGTVARRVETLRLSADFCAEAQCMEPEAATEFVLQTKGFLGCLWRAGSCLVPGHRLDAFAGVEALHFFAFLHVDD